MTKAEAIAKEAVIGSKAQMNVFEMEPVGDKIHVRLNGGVIHRAGSLSAAQETIRKRSVGLQNVSITTRGDIKVNGIDTAYQQHQERFSINERFGMLNDYAEMVAAGDANSLLVGGEGGLGKTWTIMSALIAAGYRDLSKIEAEAEIGMKVRRDKAYRFIKGYSTAKSLYRALYEDNGAVMIFDDCDSIHTDKTGANILKTALDTLDERIIHWNAEEPIGGTDLPRSFEYTGRIIFISNLRFEKMNEALLTRALRVNLQMTKPEIMERVRWILDESPDFLPAIGKAHKDEVYDIIMENLDTVQRLSLRTMILCCKIRQANKANWRDLIVNQLGV